jgi:hypothetical protein
MLLYSSTAAMNGRAEDLPTRGQRAILSAAIVDSWPILLALALGCAESNRPAAVSQASVPAPSIAAAVASGGSTGYLPAQADSGVILSATGNLPVARDELPSTAVESPLTSKQNRRVCSAEDAAKWIAAKSRYSPPWNDYPQIIQGNEYGPIDAILSLYVQLARTTKHGTFGTEDHREFESNGSGIKISGTPKSLIIELSEKRVKIGGRSFNQPRTITLFRTLGQLLTDIGSECTSQGVRGIRLGTRAYHDAITIEFSYGSVIVTLGCLANGPSDSERLYILEVVESKDADHLLNRTGVFGSH